MRRIRYVLLMLLLLTVGTAHASGSDGRACGGRTVSNDGQACCLSGMVTLDGKPVEGALVTVQIDESKKTALDDRTEYVDGDTVPTYGFVLHDEPLHAQPGDTLTISVSYKDLTRTFTHVVVEGEQWLDIELLESSAKP